MGKRTCGRRSCSCKIHFIDRDFMKKKMAKPKKKECGPIFRWALFATS
ncbi:hypothetical protein CCACVL1_22738 [Corchorus capsularis]|uniref:Uncharacterized protein n=1 Tax=Corchorus capsularis TaxID=210143 RepID=A0A1R3GWW4_COCAP|nr:hypothetical protein CCACVL1_22738 [Corchorus capsularis]